MTGIKSGKLLISGFLGLILTCLLMVFPANAQSILTNTEIERYIQTASALKTLTPATEQGPQETPKSITGNRDTISRTPVTDNLDYLKTLPNYGQFTEVITGHGFDSPASWAATGDKIVMAHSAYHLKSNSDQGGPTIGEIVAELREQQSKIEKNVFISPEMKQNLLTRIQNSVALLNDPNYIDSDNISVITPYIGRLNSLFKEPQ